MRTEGAPIVRRYSEAGMSDRQEVAIRVGFGSILAALALLACGCGGRTEAHGRPVEPPRPTVSPYKASLAFAACMRQHGVPHPNPDRNGDFHLTPRDEKLMRRAGPRRHEAAERACFHYLKPVVSTKPLSRRARALARNALAEFAHCMRAGGYDFYSEPFVKNLSRGRAFFGFRRTDPAIRKAQRIARFVRVRTECERNLNRKLDRIIAIDRGQIPY
jgi:hypothetical protein